MLFASVASIWIANFPNALKIVSANIGCPQADATPPPQRHSLGGKLPNCNNAREDRSNARTTALKELHVQRLPLWKTARLWCTTTFDHTDSKKFLRQCALKFREFEPRRAKKRAWSSIHPALAAHSAIVLQFKIGQWGFYLQQGTTFRILFD